MQHTAVVNNHVGHHIWPLCGIAVEPFMNVGPKQVSNEVSVVMIAIDDQEGRIHVLL